MANNAFFDSNCKIERQMKTKLPGLPMCATWIPELAVSLSRALDAKDCNTSEHAEQTAGLAAIISSSLGLDQRQIDLVRIGAWLHDIGKIGIPDRILNKPGPLNRNEWEIIKQHPVIGANIVQPISFFNKKNGIKEIVLYHHERYDGNGYPFGLKGDEIPLGARIVTISDAFSAMLQERPYKQSLEFARAVEEVCAHSGTQFCPYVANALCKNLCLIEEYCQKKESRNRSQACLSCACFLV
jgi:putative nucleotidyltransferase with HDIG domain